MSGALPVISRSSHVTPRSTATRAMTARASSHRWQPGRLSRVMTWPGRPCPPPAPPGAAGPGSPGPRSLATFGHASPVAAEYGAERRQGRDLGIAQVKLDHVGGEHMRAVPGEEILHVRFPPMIAVSHPVTVDLVEDPLHRRLRHRMHDEKQR